MCNSQVINVFLETVGDKSEMQLWRRGSGLIPVGRHFSVAVVCSTDTYWSLSKVFFKIQKN